MPVLMIDLWENKNIGEKNGLWMSDTTKNPYG
jgi:hypothetical protein